ncbi:MULTISPECIES: VacJ family lipoprotein [Paraburkholderia]|uniref:MlaA family lipoprotein n=1 Tax=Paraburkholderia TaxID=1822464 RepID=UPI002256A8B5|nr:MULTISPECIES: MlaA family lipoprotein [Paraburkholderia]MCX4163343.1 MlaA family lipoprotein [Paraburkholderia megapolitana]MDN7158838.1 MlaA family lipoprotein [Paraburkholderia sp. CHISQ3]MDQ6495885.1 MlaA family lipoprotein [Paraburkholderia megapolitana]
MKMRNPALALLAAGLVTGCATGPDRKPGDPFEPVNRVIFKANDAIDTHIAVPIAKGYEKVTPEPIRTALTNFFANLGDLGNAANNLLQLNITDATEDVMRFAMNSVFGIGGLIDFATPAGLPKHNQDFGLTMGRWGVPAGPYLVLPLFGPSSVRDGIGLAVDVRFNPLNYAEPALRNPLYVAQFVSKRSDLLGATDLLQQAALDKYTFVRDAYTQQRQSRVHRNGSPAAPLPDYGDPDAPASGAAAGAAGGLPNYADPGESAAPASGSGTGQPAVNAPNYSDPGESAKPAQSALGAGAAQPPVDVPNYSDPGASAKPAQSASGNSAAQAPVNAPATAPGASTKVAQPSANGAAAPATAASTPAAP